MTTKTEIVDNTKIITTYYLCFEYVHIPGGGYSFSCDELGQVDLDEMNYDAARNYQKCLNSTGDIIETGVEKYVNRIRLCACGSGEEPEDIYDGHGIYLTKVCDSCRKEKLSRYRADIFDNYETDEQIDENY